MKGLALLLLWEGLDVGGWLRDVLDVDGWLDVGGRTENYWGWVVVWNLYRGRYCKGWRVDA